MLGGAVDHQHDATIAEKLNVKDPFATHRVTVLRELMEECGMLLGRSLTLDQVEKTRTEILKDPMQFLPLYELSSVPSQLVP